MKMSPIERPPTAHEGCAAELAAGFKPTAGSGCGGRDLLALLLISAYPKASDEHVAIVSRPGSPPNFIPPTPVEAIFI